MNNSVKALIDAAIELNYACDGITNSIPDHLVKDINKQQQELFKAIENYKVASQEVKSVDEIPFELKYRISQFREAQSQYFDEDGKPYRATGFGSPMCREMLSIIDSLENYIKETNSK